MVNYQLGKIYKIVNDVNDKFYIGSTAEKYLSNRMSTHRQKHNGCMSKNIGVDLKHCSIILIENYPCKDKPELRRREREYFDKYKKECKEVFVNKYKPILYEGEKIEYVKEWNKKNKSKTKQNCKDYREKNKEKIYKQRKEYIKKNKDKLKIKRKEYLEKNKDKLKEYRKENYEKNKDKLKDKSKKIYENNKEIILKKNREKITCECGKTISKGYLNQHKKSKFHINSV